MDANGREFMKRMYLRSCRRKAAEICPPAHAGGYRCSCEYPEHAVNSCCMNSLKSAFGVTLNSVDT